MKRTIALAAAVATVLLLRRAGLREDLEWWQVVKPGKLADIDGYRVHYIDRGAGPAMLLVHGFGGQTFSFRHLIAAFERDHRVIAVDLKGFGYSERDATAGLSHSDQVRMLRDLLAHLGIDRVVLVGHSMGSAVVRRFAGTHPQMVEAVILAAAVTGEERRGAPMLPAWLLRPLLPLLAAFASSRLLSLSFANPASVTEEVRDEYRRPARIKGSMDGLLAMMRDARFDTPIDDSAIGAPVLLLAGAEDRVVPASAAVSLQRALPQARLVVVDRAGHLLLEERPDDCARAIASFLGEHMRPRSALAPAATP